jgi:hypothetical protein
MEKIYELVYSTYDYEEHYLFYGPECEDFQAFCESLLKDACDLSLSKNKTSCVGWNTIVVSLAEILLQHGYRRIEPVIAEFSGLSVIDDENDYEGRSSELVNGIIQHNRRILDKY